LFKQAKTRGDIAQLPKDFQNLNITDDSGFLPDTLG